MSLEIQNLCGFTWVEKQINTYALGASTASEVPRCITTIPSSANSWIGTSKLNANTWAWNVVLRDPRFLNKRLNCPSWTMVCPWCQRKLHGSWLFGTWPLCLSGCQTCRLRFVEYLSSFVSKDTIHCGVSTRGLAKYVRSHACSVSLTIICLNNLCIDESLSAFFFSCLW